MVTEPKTKAPVTRRRNSSTRSSRSTTGICYWLALNTVRNALDPYNDHRHVENKGRLLRPTALTTDRVEVSLFPSICLKEERRKDLTLIAVGAIEAYPK
ncbi:hypothetical protein [Bradyrhizobium sp. SZCCHNRI3052]|uniref:hypothetical protein n=1 Tax=Bradyrhizobium sp. SZCCHNRI3052 TaxID=3057295 RepID=UPI002915FF73|nr:hypothetical protein [Bradyrhizobium sp. SZCCHNRI3052]